MSWLITDLTGPREFLIPKIVGARQASVPVSETIDNTSNIVIPVPNNVIAGDLLLAIVWGGTVIPQHIIPPGWTRVINNPNGSINPSIYKRIAGINEPASYTWVVPNPAGAKTGNMIAIRDANPILGEVKSSQAVGYALPDLTNNIENSILVAFSSDQLDLNPGSNKEAFIANAPLIEQAQHASEGIAGYTPPRQGSIVAAEEGLSVGVISGRSFSNPISFLGNETNFGVIVEGY